MILSATSSEDLDDILDKVGIVAALKKSRSVLLKVNLARPPEPGHPRTDPGLLTNLIRYFTRQGADCAIAECADGFLPHNLKQVGLEQVVQEHNVKVIDLDLEDYDLVIVDDEKHYLPRCLKNYGIRIGVPALSKRPGMTFSNNVKLFVGVVPRRMYQLDQPTTRRPRVHIHLHRSIANIYRAIMEYAPFGFFINGGRMMIEGQGEMDRQVVLAGDNALELDRYLLKQFNLEIPEYITRLIEFGSTTSRATHPPLIHR